MSVRPVLAAEPVGEDAAVAGLSATLVKPAGVARPPVVLLIAGSGPTDRNGNQVGIALGGVVVPRDRQWHFLAK